MAFDETVYTVLVSRGHTVDALALRHTVSRGGAYVGMIGSRRRTATVLQMLRDEGYSEDDLAKVHTPIGLDIGAETPEEIALAILAEMVLIRKGGTGRMLSAMQNRRAAQAI
jgi:xanthine dehydrogenase accessory factor